MLELIIQYWYYLLILVGFIGIIILFSKRINKKEAEKLKTDALVIFNKFLPDAKQWIMENASLVMDGKLKFENVYTKLLAELPSAVKTVIGTKEMKQLLQDFYLSIKDTEEFKEKEVINKDVK